MSFSKTIIRCVILTITSVVSLPLLRAEHDFNDVYTGKNIEKIAFPIGGIGAGNFFIEGNGSISGISVKHRLNYFNEPTFFSAICVKGATPSDNVAKALEGPVPEYKTFGRPGSALGSGEKTYGLPRFTNADFSSSFPFCNIRLTDDVLPLSVEIIGFSPFIPNEPDLSGMPVGALEYVLTNESSDTLETVFSVNARNFMGGDAFERLEKGFNVIGSDGKFAIVVDEEPENIHVDCCWFRGGWFDSLTTTWNNILRGELVDNPPDDGQSPGASLFVPITLSPREKRTVRLLTAWYVPTSNISSIGGNDFNKEKLDESPAKGTAQSQQKVTGYLGNQLVNTYYPHGDRHVGKIVSPIFMAQKKYLYFKIGGGSLPEVGVSIQEKRANGFTDRKIFRGKNAEKLEWVQFDLSELEAREFRISIFDDTTDPWGHINADSFILSDFDADEFNKRIHEYENSAVSSNLDFVELEGFEGIDYGRWTVVQLINTEASSPKDSTTYVPWYATQFNSELEALEVFMSRYDELRNRSELFVKTLKKSSLAPEITEAIEANLAILKTPTVLRQYDGRLWAWEGCQDSDGSCPGTCTHVWNYTQALPHLFPSLERSFRQNEFNESLTEEGRQAFRGNLPIIPGGTAWDASDGQLGTIMRVHREWSISGSQEFLEAFWPKVKLSLDYCIRMWDPDETGLLEKSHHNTYDINYLGPESHCGSFYLGALAAACKMGEAYGDDVSKYRELLAKGSKRFENELFNGEYFIQIIPESGSEGNSEGQSLFYQDVARKIDSQGPKYQYGNGCLSDGVLGFWIAKVCGIDDDIVNPELIRSHLLAVYKYNFKRDLSSHANTQRPTYAFGKDGGLLLCSWPRHDKPYIPFPYSDEVWTGIEYQVASHLAFFGEYEKTEEIVRTCRKRYDGTKRNPFDEYECGHFYSRAMSSFGLLQGMTGVRYDAVSKTLYYRAIDHNYTVPIFTESGYGTVCYDKETQQVSLKIVEGSIDVQHRQIVK